MLRERIAFEVKNLFVVLACSGLSIAAMRICDCLPRTLRYALTGMTLTAVAIQLILAAIGIASVYLISKGHGGSQ